VESESEPQLDAVDNTSTDSPPEFGELKLASFLRAIDSLKRLPTGQPLEARHAWAEIPPSAQPGARPQPDRTARH
jgi:hypothetical protein